MVPPLLTDLSVPLDQAVQPTRWEHLSGPFAWYRLLQGYEPYKDGRGKRVRLVGEVGAMVRSLATTGRFHRPAFLLAGEGGVGKSALLKLIARSFLNYDKLEPVSWEAEENGEVFRLYILDENGEELRINPPEPGRNDAVLTAFTRPGSESAFACRVYNSGVTRKEDVDRIMADLALAPPLLAGGGEARRVLVMNELDQLEKRQVVSMKVGLDNATFPPQVLFLGDTNELDTVRAAFGVPGMQRFDVIQVGTWSLDKLFEYAGYYCDELGISFGPTSDGQDPIAMLADDASGSIRLLLHRLGTLRQLRQPIPFADFQRILGRGADGDASEISGLAASFVERSRRATNFDLASFIARAAENGASLPQLLEGIAIRLRQGMPQLIMKPEVAGALGQLYDLVRTPTTVPLGNMKWLAAAGPLSTLSAEIRAMPERPARRSGASPRA